MTGLTVAALAVVGFFAYQADAAQDRPATAGKRPAPSLSPTTGTSTAPATRAPRHPAPPADSGRGKRVVYALAADRVWLVRADGTVGQTYRVKPSTVDPPPGVYTVTSRSPRVTGSDGVPVENVVRFALVQGTVIGFSATVDGSMADPDPQRKTGGIRAARADGAAMWRFTDIGSRVVVVR